MSTEGLEPITGTWPPDELAEERPPDIPAHEGYDQAWKDALKKAEDHWHRRGDPEKRIWVKVEYFARIDIWNPGGIGQYVVKLSPGSP